MFIDNPFLYENFVCVGGVRSLEVKERLSET